ncbi:hypothetical protein [Nocardia fluminea]|uniref:Uncharacterized protein n=1 Tax=Nocardia fluminea TaxID=134984 RepID=A0A2N3V563_9NOCA|nr:hypothetical protein [Nocardia fluminea]PKV76768.1 hypothetical protein ATK86_7171 [Nocardia fluminea]
MSIKGRAAGAAAVAAVTCLVIWFIVGFGGLPTSSDHEPDQTYYPDGWYLATIVSLAAALVTTVVIDRAVGVVSSKATAGFFLGFMLGIVVFLIRFPWGNLDLGGGQAFSLLDWWLAPILAVAFYLGGALLDRPQPTPAAPPSSSPRAGGVTHSSGSGNAFDTVVARVAAQKQQATRETQAAQSARLTEAHQVADELSALLRTLAEHVNQYVGPETFQVGPRGRKAERRSPAGWPLTGGERSSAAGYHLATFLAADGRVWQYSYSGPGSPVNAEYIDLRAMFEMSSSYRLSGVTFSKRVGGGLGASIGKDPSQPVDPTEAVARMAVEIIEGGHQA